MNKPRSLCVKKHLFLVLAVICLVLIACNPNVGKTPEPGESPEKPSEATLAGKTFTIALSDSTREVEDNSFERVTVDFISDEKADVTLFFRDSTGSFIRPESNLSVASDESGSLSIVLYQNSKLKFAKNEEGIVSDPRFSAGSKSYSGNAEQITKKTAFDDLSKFAGSMYFGPSGTGDTAFSIQFSNTAMNFMLFTNHVVAEDKSGNYIMNGDVKFESPSIIYEGLQVEENTIKCRIDEDRIITLNEDGSITLMADYHGATEVGPDQTFKLFRVK